MKIEPREKVLIDTAAFVGILVSRDENHQFYRERPDKEWSLTDYASFVVMREREITLAFTSDKHFEQAGFTRLLEK